MKMQNSELNFIRFDAGDVLTTSGIISFKLTAALCDLKDRSDWKYYSGAWFVPDYSNKVSFTILDSSYTDIQSENKYYTLAPGATYSYMPFDEFGNANLFIFATEGKVGKEYTSLTEIIEWLKINGNTQ